MEAKMEVSIASEVDFLLLLLNFGSTAENPVKSRKMKIRLPWELSTIYSEHLRGPGGDDREDEDEDDIEAHEDSLQRLKVSSRGQCCSELI
jgi:hypothetical protein